MDAYLALVTSALSRKMDDLANGAPSKRPKGAPSLEDVDGAMESDMTASARASEEDKMVVAEDSNDDDSRRAVGKEEMVGVISCTEELSKNVVGTGVPPTLPMYTKLAMWRGEDVCLNQLGAGGMKELMVSITWCQPKGYHQSIDLDRSVMVSSPGFRCCFLPDSTKVDGNPTLKQQYHT